MSSSPPTRWSSRALLLIVLPVLIILPVLLAAPGAVAQPPLVVVPAGSADGQARLVVQVPGGPVPPDAIGASVNGEHLDARAEPVLSERLAAALVVDASADGSPMLPVGLAGAANLVLAAPPTTRSTLVTDSTPPAVAPAAFRSVRIYQEVAPPVRLRVPAVRIDTPLQRLGRAADATVEVPADFGVAGWFADGPRPGQSGPAANQPATPKSRGTSTVESAARPSRCSGVSIRTAGIRRRTGGATS